jgi:hypothetical protein
VLSGGCAEIVSSVRDLSPVPGGTGATAPRHTLAQARQAKSMGYFLFRLAGHHKTPGTDQWTVRADSLAQDVTQVRDIAAMQTRSRGRAPFPASAGLRQSGCRDHVFAARSRRQGPASGKGRQKSHAERASGA